MMTTLLPLFRVPTSFTPFDGERFIGVCSSAGPFSFSFLSRMETPLSARPADFVTRMVRQQGLRRVDYGQNEASSGVVGSGDSCGGGRDSRWMLRPAGIPEGLPPATAELKPPKWILPLRLPGVLIPSSFRKGSSFVRARCWRKWIPAYCRSSGWRRLRRLKRPKARLPPPAPCWSNARVKCAPRSRSSNSGKLSWTPSLNVTCVLVRCRSVARYLYNS